MPFVHRLLAIIGYAGLIVAAGYAAVAAVAVLVWHARRTLAGTQRAVAEQLQGWGLAHSFYRVSDPKKNGGRESIDYARGDRIIVHMKTEGERGVDQVKIDGHVDGVHLVPLPPPDSTAARLPAKGER
jgi:hypothetical protein